MPNTRSHEGSGAGARMSEKEGSAKAKYVSCSKVSDSYQEKLL
jgi:hypothetical protein